MEKSNEMETANIKKLAIKVSLPMVMSMISIALYGIVDTIFVSNISENALESVSLSIPFQSIITSIGLGIGIGINSVLAKSLGEKNTEKSNKIVGYGIIFTFISWVITAIISIFTIKPFFQFFTSNLSLQQSGYQYLSIISILSFGTLYQILFEKILEAYGKTKTSMIVQFSGTIVNLILDPILIFGFYKIPAMGIKGAAIATITGQIFGMIIGIISIISRSMFKLKMFIKTKTEKQTILSIFKVGFPTFILEALNSFITIYLNKILISFSNEAVSVWGIYNQLQKFVLIIVYGLNYGMIPILAYNWGAKHKNRIKECIKFFLELACGVTLVGELLFFITPNFLLSFFKVSENVLQIAIPAFKILSFGFIFSGISLVISSVAQAFGNGTYSLIINLLRKLIIVVPFVFIFKNIMEIYSVWLSFTIAEVITTIIAIFLYKNIRKKIIDKI